MVRRTGHTRSASAARRQLFWVRYSAFVEFREATVGNPNAFTLLDPGAFTPSSTGTYPFPDTNRVLTVHRIKLHYNASFGQFDSTNGTALYSTLYMGIRKGAKLPVHSPAVGDSVSAAGDWLDLWEDNAINPPGNNATESRNTANQLPRDIKTKRTLDQQEVLVLEGKYFANGGTPDVTLGDDPAWQVNFVVSMLLSRST